ncbi:two-component response regulator [Arcticibacter svalbardensis MN12-7]|uniref:Two-component response regulator n=1 Tax=Arcticibacter svalbardensis MN12-7 TaxID=1150600 RepID=R9GM86_9SPHI|nr:response regulator [Arcticibacter svalbardensis]EOR92952.1 two-component response regulator [Arcticibacter svalbardensis MN12-7]
MKVKNKILILDDDRYILDVLNEALTYADFEVKTALDIDSFYLELDSNKPDLVLIDFLLKGINGGEICHQLKITDVTDSIPVILMSGYPKVFGSLGTYGCDEFIAKPFDLYTLIDKIQGYMSISAIN